jgi:hypothetical protein
VQSGPPGIIPVLLFSLAFAVVTTVLMMWFGQGGTRLVGSAGADSGAVAPVGDRTPDKYWKLGLIYINRNDPALFVEKTLRVRVHAQPRPPGRLDFPGCARSRGGGNHLHRPAPSPTLGGADVRRGVIRPGEGRNE